MPVTPMDIPGPKKKVLVIEDDPDVARMLVTLLGRLDVEVSVAPETRAALAGLGHVVDEQPQRDWRSGAVCAIVVRPDGTLMAGADPRRGAHAIGW